MFLSQYLIILYYLGYFIYLGRRYISIET